MTDGQMVCHHLVIDIHHTVYSIADPSDKKHRLAFISTMLCHATGAFVENSTNNKNLLLTKLIFTRNAFLIVMASTHVDKIIKPIYDQKWFSHLILLHHALICF